LNHHEKRPAQAWPLTIASTVEEALAIVAPAGRIGHASADVLRRALAAALADGRRLVALDLTNVDYVSGAGLIVLDEMAERLRGEGGAFVICGLTEGTRVVFELAGWADRFAIAESRGEAVRRLRAGPPGRTG
jgi:anti-anti-sigma factor